MNVTHEPLLYLAVAAATPAAALAAQSPEMLVHAPTTSALGFVGIMLWQMKTAVTAHLGSVAAHRQLEVAEWTRQSAHRDAERDHWRSSST